MTWEMIFATFLIGGVVVFGAYGAWKTRDRDL